MSTTEVITNKELKTLIAKRGDFKVSEVEGFLEAMSYVMIKAIKEHKTVKFNDLLTIEPYQPTPRRMISVHGKEVLTSPKRTVRVKLSSYLKRMLNPEK